jgi:hypothetical protein
LEIFSSNSSKKHFSIKVLKFQSYQVWKIV